MAAQTGFGQKYCVLQVEIIDTDTTNYKLKNAFLHDAEKILDNHLISTNNVNHIIINEVDIPSKTDSVYLIISDFEDGNHDVKIFIKDLHLFEYNTFENYKMKILEYRILNEKEYRNYLKNYMLLPKRKEVRAIDVH